MFTITKRTRGRIWFYAPAFDTDPRARGFTIAVFYNEVRRGRLLRVHTR